MPTYSCSRRGGTIVVFADTEREAVVTAGTGEAHILVLATTHRTVTGWHGALTIATPPSWTL